MTGSVPTPFHINDVTEVTDAHDEGSVNIRLTLTFTAPSVRLGRIISDCVVETLVGQAGTAHVPALPTDDDRDFD